MSNDSFEKFLASLGQPEVLTREEENVIIARAQAGNTRARRTLLCNHHRFVLSLAKKMSSTRFPLDAAFQAGMIGLNQAIDAYDATQGVRLLSYASHKIRKEIRNAFDRESRTIYLPKNVAVMTRKSARAKAVHLARYGEAASDETMGVALGVTRERFENVRDGLRAQPDTIDKPVTDGGTVTLRDMLTDDNAVDACTLFEKEEKLAKLWKIVEEKFTTLQRQILHERFVKDHTLEETALRVAPYTRSKKPFTRERVRQIEEELISKLRRALRE